MHQNEQASEFHQKVQTIKPDIITKANVSILSQSSAFFLPLLKEPGRSSGFFVQHIKRKLCFLQNTKRFKVGHTGTLDPFAQGVLPILGGKATRLQSYYMNMPKSYRTTVVFGATSPSLDPETPLLEEDPDFYLEEKELLSALECFKGDFDQTPPLYSAKRIQGKRAYHFARKGLEVKLQPRRVSVYEIKVLNFEQQSVELEIQCGSGFYVRAFARDLAAQLGSVGYLKELTRISAGGAELEECLRLSDVLALQKAPEHPHGKTNLLD